MSTVQKVNFEPVRNILHVQTAAFALANASLARPDVTNAVVDGEWMALDASDRLIRAADISQVAGTAATAPSYPLWSEKGRTDAQAMAEPRKSVLYLGPWEYNTRIFNATSMVLNGLVSVAVVELGGVRYSGLVANGTFASAGTGITVGIVTKLPASNGGRLRIRGGMFF